MVFGVRLLSLRNVFKVHRIVARISTSLLYFPFIPLYYCIVSHCIVDVPHFVYPWTFLAIIYHTTMNIHVDFLCRCTFSFILGIYLEVELLGRMLILGDASRLFSKLDVPAIPQQCRKVPISPHSCQHLLFSTFLIIAIVVSVQLLTALSIFQCVHWFIHISSLETCPFNHLPIINWLFSYN